MVTTLPTIWDPAARVVGSASLPALNLERLLFTGSSLRRRLRLRLSPRLTRLILVEDHTDGKRAYKRERGSGEGCDTRGLPVVLWLSDHTCQRDHRSGCEVLSAGGRDIPAGGKRG